MFSCVCALLHTQIHSVWVSTDARRGGRMPRSWRLGQTGVEPVSIYENLCSLGKMGVEPIDIYENLCVFRQQYSFKTYLGWGRCLGDRHVSMT